ncbi:PAS domain-containing protein [Hymenobacter psychrotolerans]|uniref:histidine kinase n=1 Tax=Hymenobacter psychrotolerans DSM 18569 TaxID=1121959 RepID=A0A1M7EYY0_9BACT|nr:PAS domain-containing protein [Hymenobacter psychrotolerans]SHL96737.1 PAS domain S-box-containing protein [Hymenobacter psychrotolerans DSM 18569]
MSYLFPATADELLALLRDVLATSLTPMYLGRPVYSAEGVITDFTLAYLNPAGQALLSLPERPDRTLGACFPATEQPGILAFYRQVFTTGEPGRFPVDSHGQAQQATVAARRSGEWLVISLLTGPAPDMKGCPPTRLASDAAGRVNAEQPPSQHHHRLEQEPARHDELAAAMRAAERERNVLQAVLTQAPVAIGVFQGADLTVAAANDQLCRMWGYAPEHVLGRPLLEGVPELREQGFDTLLTEVARTRVPFVGTEVAAALRQPAGDVATHYFNFVYQPLYDAAGELLGVLDIAIDVTAQVVARQQVQDLNERLVATNEELLAANDALQATNQELLRAQLQLQQLTQDLETRVQERTRAATLAQAAAEHQRAQLNTLFMQAPAAICVLHGPEWVYELVNPGYQQAFPGRRLLGKPLLEALPELRDSPIPGILREVMATGQVFHAEEMPVSLAREAAAPVEMLHWTFTYQPRRNAFGQVDGVLVFAYDVTESVRARQAQRAQQAELERLFAQAPVGIAILRGPALVVELANEAVQAIWGRSAAQVVGRPYFEALPETAGQGFEAILAGVLATGEPFFVTEAPVRLPARGDKPPGPAYVNFGFHPLRNEQGEVTGLLALGVEVTEQVRARQQAEALQAERLHLAQAQARQRQNIYQVFEQAPVAIILLREPDHRVEYFNPAYRTLFPHPPAVGTTIAQSQPAAVELGLVALLDRVYQTGEAHVGVELSLAPFHAGPERYVNFTYQAYREQERIVGVSVFVYDVTEQVVARQLREAQQRQLHAVFTQAPVAICVFQGPAYVLDVVNPLMGEMLGHAPAELLGQAFFAALPELADQGFPELLDAVRITGETYRAQAQAIHLARHAAGEVGYFDFVYEPLRDAQGLVAGIVCVATEVTAQVRARQREQVINDELTAANEALHTSNTELTRVNKDLDTFIYTASHDLKGPITNIEGLLTALREELVLPPAEADTATVLHLMDDSVQRFQRTLQHLTDVTRLHAPAQLPVTAVSLAALVADIRLDLHPLLVVSGGHVTVDPDGCELVTFAEKHLRSILYNLISNGLKYRSPDRAPRVVVRCHLRDQEIVLEVQDNGLGLTQAQQARVFGLFQRVHEHIEGSGIGLYLVKQVIGAAGGRISLESQAGVGSLFRVVLPQPSPTFAPDVS